MELRTKKYNLWNIEGIDFSAFQILPIVILVSFLSFSCQGNSSKKLNDSATVKSKPSIQVSQQLQAFPAQYDSLVGWEFKNNSIPDWKHVIFDYDNENKLDILTFRGGNQRNSPVIGELEFTPKSLKLLWDFQTNVDTLKGRYGYWGGGAGWTGQPLLLNWSAKECKDVHSLFDAYKSRNKELKEIVQISLSGYIYFLDFETGKKTREPIYISNPIKGTPSVDPLKRFLLVGQGVPHRGGFHWRCFDLKTCKLLHEEKTPSSYAFRGWGASDASPLFSKDAKFIWPTESGVIYFGQSTDKGINQLAQAHYRFTVPSKQGTESSPSAFANLIYMTDNGGTVICFDVNNMKPRWHYASGDDNDATPVVDIENGVPFIYIGNEVDKQGDSGKSSFSKLNGLTGKLVWKYSKICNSVFGKKPNNGGILSTCCIGKGKMKSYVWTVFSRLGKSTSGKLVCINKETGTLKYEIQLNQFSWVSPILLYDQSGNGYIYLADVGGNVYIFNAETGEIIFKKNIGNTFESSPIAYKNFIIQPARGNRILCFQIE